MKPERKLKTEKVAKTVLAALAAAGVVGAVIIFPGMAVVLDWIDKKAGGHRKTSKRSLYNLQKRGMLKFRTRNNQIELVLTEKGKRQAFKYQLADLTIQKPDHWDKRWRLVMFDVPESTRNRRDMIRLKLRQFNFLPIQKSVFIHPYPCLELIESLRDFYQLAPGQLYIFEARVLEGEAILKKRFGL